MTRTLKLGIAQMSMTDQLEENVTKAIAMVREAAAQGAGVILLPELFENLYWCQVQRESYFDLANPLENHPFISRFQALARELGVVLPVSFFEKAGHAHYNSLAMIDSSGEVLGVYRKSHIPDGPGYMEKYYFNPGDTGFKAFGTHPGGVVSNLNAMVGAGICWDQWYPESARAMALQGAEILLYPTAIGSEPEEAGSTDTRAMWQRAMVGHAVANLCYLGAANRVGAETVEGLEQTYYGSSFIADYTGEKIAEAGTAEETVLVAELDLERASRFRAGFGFFRDRRPELYGSILTLDGKTRKV
jgi:N-carbamoylputrescine amidase